MRKLKLDELNRLSAAEFKTREKFPVSIVLDNIRSGYNVGSFFRTADAFAIDKIFICGFTPVPPHPEIFKTAIGAEETVVWEYVAGVGSLIRDLKTAGKYCVGIEQTDASVPLHEVRFPDQPLALVFGNEVNGITETILEDLDAVWEVPQFGTKHSLNVSVCGGIVLWEVVRGMIS